jgi:hypothetical protein
MGMVYLTQNASIDKEIITMIGNICRPGSDLELKVHDGIIGAVTLLSVVAGSMVNPVWLWLAGVIGVVMISSAFTGFCPLHFLLSKVIPLNN